MNNDERAAFEAWAKKEAIGLGHWNAGRIIAQAAWQARAALAAQQVPTNHRHVSVDVGVLQMVRNALSRDAEEGRIVRGEMLEELEKSIAMLAAVTQAPAVPGTIDLRKIAERAGISMDCWDMGAASMAYSEGCQGITRAHLEKFAANYGFACWNAARDLDLQIRAALEAPQPAPQAPLTDEQIEHGRSETFSTENPFCPCDSKTMRKAVRWAERAHGIRAAGVKEPT